MIAVQESFAQIIVPYGITLSNNAVQLLNESGLVVFRFFIMAIAAYGYGHSSGQDEGPKAIVALKSLEASFYPALLVILLFFLPMDATPSVSYKHYACNATTEENGLTDVMSDSSALTDMESAILSDSSFKTSIGIGATNMIATGMSESLSSQLECPSSDAITARMQQRFIKVTEPILSGSLIQFNQQCYSPAMTLMADAVVNGTRNDVTDPYSYTGNLFFGDNMMSVYKGTYSSNSPSVMRMTINADAWYDGAQNSYEGSDFDTTNTLIIPCANAANDLYGDLKTYVEKYYSDRIDNIYNSVSQYPSAEEQSGDSTVKTKTEVERGFINQAFTDVVVGKAQLIYKDIDVVNTEKDKAEESVWDKIYHFFIRGKDDISKANVMNNTLTLGLHLKNIDAASQLSNIYAVWPLYVSIFLTTFYSMAPFIFWLSGFTISSVKNFILMNVFISGFYYVINISHAITNVILMLSNSYYGKYNLMENGGLALDYISNSIPFILSIIWLTIFVLAGMKLPGIINSLLMTTAGAAGKTGVGIATSAITKLVR